VREACWDESRAARGASPGPRLARCTTRACPVRYRSGPDRLCPWCRLDELDAAASGARLLRFAILPWAAGEDDDDEQVNTG
jgi:hypothetical protein